MYLTVKGTRLELHCMFMQFLKSQKGRGRAQRRKVSCTVETLPFKLPGYGILSTSLTHNLIYASRAAFVYYVRMQTLEEMVERRG